MIELKDVIHYYIGVKCKTPDGQIGELFGVNGEKVELHLDKGYAAVRFKHVKPILKRLENMTEEDAIELARLVVHEDEYTNPFVFRNNWDDMVVSWGGGSIGLDNSFNATSERVWGSDQFNWLLKNGFDLFGLIPDQAIDSKTINNPVELDPYDDEPGV